MTDYRDPNYRDPNQPGYRDPSYPAASWSNATWGWIAGISVVVLILIFAFGMMLFLLATTYFGSLRLPFAVVGHEGSTVLVILNGLRLLAFKRRL